MTKEELTKKINELKEKIFYLEMKDYWDVDDRLTINRWHRELRELERQRDTL